MFSMLPLRSSGLVFLCRLMNQPQVREQVHIGQTSPAFWWRAYQVWRRDTEEWNFLICRHRRPVGWLKLNQTGQRLWISMLVVSPTLQRSGAGTFALRWAERFAARHGFLSVNLHTTIDNLPAQRCYLKNEYRITGRDWCTTSDGGYHMRYTFYKDLQGGGERNTK